jgi:ABC-2 type transport system ATP-binding protein
VKVKLKASAAVIGAPDGRERDDRIEPLYRGGGKPATMTVIEASGLRKAYGGTEALAGVSLSVGAGDVFALVGPNGAGKTTLVRCLTGTTSPDDGEAALFGSPPRTVAASRIGLLPQDFDPPERLTARELLAYYAGLYDEARAVGGLLDDVGVAGVADTRYANLSGGEQRRTLLGTALVNDPDALFLDEPTTGIDPAGRRAVWGLIEDLAAGGATVFLTTHDMAEVERLADRVGVLADGELIAVDAPGALVAQYGGDARLLVETDADPDVPGYDAETVDRGIVVRDVRPGDIGDVVAALAAAGIEYDALSWRESDVETVYLELTGESPLRGRENPDAVADRARSDQIGTSPGGVDP